MPNRYCTHTRIALVFLILIVLMIIPSCALRTSTKGNVLIRVNFSMNRTISFCFTWYMMDHKIIIYKLAKDFYEILLAN